MLWQTTHAAPGRTFCLVNEAKQDFPSFAPASTGKIPEQDRFAARPRHDPSGHTALRKVNQHTAGNAPNTQRELFFGKQNPQWKRRHQTSQLVFDPRINQTRDFCSPRQTSEKNLLPEMECH